MGNVVDCSRKCRKCSGKYAIFGVHWKIWNSLKAENIVHNEKWGMCQCKAWRWNICSSQTFCSRFSSQTMEKGRNYQSVNLFQDLITEKKGKKSKSNNKNCIQTWVNFRWCIPPLLPPSPFLLPRLLLWDYWQGSTARARESRPHP